MLKNLTIAAAMLLIAGCAATSSNIVAEKSAASHDQQVCLLKTALPASVKHRVVGAVESSKEWYGSQTELYPMMADEARRMGADVVVNMTTAHKMGPLAWARPVGTGSAIKLDDRKDLNCATWGGELR